MSTTGDAVCTCEGGVCSTCGYEGRLVRISAEEVCQRAKACGYALAWRACAWTSVIVGALRNADVPVLRHVLHELGVRPKAIALHYAVLHNNVAMAHMVMDHGACGVNTEVRFPCLKGDEEEEEEEEEWEEAPLDVLDWLRPKMEHRCLPLMTAVFHNHVEMARVLLAHGADPNGCVDDIHVLCAAVRNDSMPLARMLVEAGLTAQVRARGLLALRQVLYTRNADMLRLLLQACQAGVDWSERTTAIAAAQFAHEMMTVRWDDGLRLLLDPQFCVFEVDSAPLQSLGWPSLMCVAIRSNVVRYVRMVMERGARIDMQEMSTLAIRAIDEARLRCIWAALRGPDAQQQLYTSFPQTHAFVLEAMAQRAVALLLEARLQGFNTDPFGEVLSPRTRSVLRTTKELMQHVLTVRKHGWRSRQGWPCLPVAVRRTAVALVLVGRRLLQPSQRQAWSGAGVTLVMAHMLQERHLIRCMLDERGM